jgi:hypothetical protein
MSQQHRRLRLDRGDRVGMQPLMTELHFFNRESGRRLEPEQAARAEPVSTPAA